METRIARHLLCWKDIERTPAFESIITPVALPENKETDVRS
jgi:hypothetical protein